MDYQIKTQYDLKRAYQAEHPDGHFFDRETLKFFGERMSDMRLCGKQTVQTYSGEEHTCYALRSKGKSFYDGSAKYSMHYFDVNTLELVYPKE